MVRLEYILQGIKQGEAEWQSRLTKQRLLVTPDILIKLKLVRSGSAGLADVKMILACHGKKIILPKIYPRIHFGCQNLS